ncbi:MAG: response regulator transcription factor [Spirochaetales bacterium]
MIHIAIADDHILIREGIKTLCAETDDLRIVLDLSDGEALLEAPAQLADIDVLLLDIGLARSNGLEVLGSLQAMGCAPPTLFLTMHPEHELALRAMQAGARGYITKDSDPATMRDAIRVVANGGYYMTRKGLDFLHSIVSMQGQAQQATGPVPQAEQKTGMLDDLSPQEQRVLTMLCQGRTMKEIGYDLAIGEKTVSTYKHRLMAKLDISSTVELVRFGLRNNIG